MNQRDHSLDFLKGIGCMLMVFSHSYVVSNTSLLFIMASIGAFMGRLAPILFFSVSGVVNALQAKRRPLRYFAVFAGLFAILGLIYNAYWRPDFGTGIESDIPQIVAMTILATVIVEKTFKNPTVGYALVAGVLALLHFIVGPLVPAFPGRQFLFVPLEGPGVFPLTPWLIFPMLGNIAYRLADTTIRRIAYGLSGLLVAALVISYFMLPSTVYKPFWTDKYAMTLGYFVLSVTLLYVIYAFMRGAGTKLIHPLVTYIGRNSFPFMFIHIIWIRLFKYLDVTNPLIVWPMVLVLTVPTIMLFDRLQKERVERLFLSPVAWVIYAVALAVQIVYIHDYSFLLYVLGLVFAYEYRPLAQALKAYFTPKSQDQAPVPQQPTSA